MVLGIGLILLSFFIGFLSGMNDCSELVDENIKAIDSFANSTLDAEVLLQFSSNSDAWSISCFNQNIMAALVSTIIFTLGILFVIIGFLESKK